VLPQRLTQVRDTCNVWVIRNGRDAVCIDIGAGTVFDRLDELGLDRVTDVLVTHHHRDNAQGLARAAAAGARIWVPPVEQELFTDVEEFWARRRISDSYDLRQVSLTLLEPVPVAGTVDEYRTREYGGIEIYTLPTPGHTSGSVTYLAVVDGRRLGFSGDLLWGPGRLWSLAATQWSYSGVEGQVATILSCGMLARRDPDVLLPAHGEPMEDPAAALRETQERLAELMELRRDAPAPFGYERWLEDPWRALSPHLLQNTTSIATSYALLSDSGAALIVDWGYDLWAGWPLGGERYTNRPLLESIDALRRNHGVTKVETLVTTHYHDDHVAGANLLRDVEGAQVWAAENVAPILEAPDRYDIPCLWFEPIPVDRVLPFGEPIAWHEYSLTVHPLPGHTRYASAIEFEVDGKRVLATGDQQTSPNGSGRSVLNYQYRNRFALGDYVASAVLYERVEPDLLLTGHWGAHELTAEQRARLAEDGRRLDELHRELQPIADAEGLFARITPYRITVAAGASFDVAVELRNPYTESVTAVVELVLPHGFSSDEPRAEVELRPREERAVTLTVKAPSTAGRRPFAVELALGDLRLGQHAEALVTVT
jgi:glyoxylase-like metal-dependent hydrolase (beta-lactamase superfamily II)